MGMGTGTKQFFIHEVYTFKICSKSELDFFFKDMLPFSFFKGKLRTMKKMIRRLFFLALFVLSLYGLGRLYFRLTAGFTITNITSDFSFQPQWETRPLLAEEQAEFAKAIDQPYSYLGKGCQAYVFASQDGQYVIKFFKYQRYRLQSWLAYFPPLPAIVKYRQEKLEKKWKKLDGFVQSWKIAFDNLKEETGLLFVHLNKTQNILQQLTIYDKMGQKHLVDLDKMEFCIQRRATLLCDTLLDFKANEDLRGGSQLIHRLINLILSEYSRGLADNDHALMQNTGVAQGNPVHIDVGQFVFNEAVKQPFIFHQELFTKTYKFKLWLRENYPELGEYLENELSQIIGPAYSTMQPQFRKK
jgi:hypothetical protein